MLLTLQHQLESIDDPRDAWIRDRLADLDVELSRR
jgi:hypothetical protein